MTKDSDKDQAQPGQGKQAGQDVDALKRHPDNQPGHEHTGGHEGQQSGGMGGMHGGDLHDIGSAHSGMTGGAGLGGNPSAGADDSQFADQGNQQRAEAGGHDIAEIQQSAQREGMGQHRHRNHGNQGLELTDADDVGSRAGAVAGAKAAFKADPKANKTPDKQH